MSSEFSCSYFVKVCCVLQKWSVLLGDVGAGKSSLVLRFVKEQFVEFQDSRCKIEGYLVVLHGVG
ncbi:ras-related protein RABF2b-like [Pyrus ussuriensis x Pyrus communis]|uniref:Ras-related protein RABF2b-like n=1 Tax=Pyrus ussuriensis x Pyrus communis TaxID=2448454 RepID=A0A5N5IEX6_9ROSA|nr:ras-related protein RABF2b-like [Pyrus ussuriensis x Pyrus communis]